MKQLIFLGLLLTIAVRNASYCSLWGRIQCIILCHLNVPIVTRSAWKFRHLIWLLVTDLKRGKMIG
ncbi:hypothetical protein B0O99DRAFT_617525 [Bisporella sp. PMI_857]|nr:hypothetical protein B0O99DRAFT_617525 [Bisporella sp. PMI_857]